MQNKFNEKDSSIAFLLALFLPSVLAIFCVLIISFFVSPNSLQDSLAYKIISVLISQVAFLLIFVGITKARKISFKQVRHEKLNFKQILILLLISACCLFLISPIINVYDSLLVKLGVKQQTLPLSLDNPLNFVFLLFSMGVFAPITEELLFRGLIFQGLKSKGTTKAVLISSLMFMIMHLSLHQTIYQFLLGIIMALIVLYTESIFASIFVHFVNNSVVLIINYINPQLFEYKFLSSGYIILAVVLFMFAMFLIYYLLKGLKKMKHKDKQRSENIINTNNLNDSLETVSTNQGVKKVNLVMISLLSGILLWIINLILQI